MKIDKVAIIGAGTMGASIATAFITNGFTVLLKDTEETALQKGRERIEKMLSSLVKRGLSPAEAEFAQQRLTARTSYAGFSDVQLVIEAVVEKLEVKHQVFSELDEICPAETIFASNTSSLSITQIASCTRRSSQVVGLHFFNPAHLMKLVEVIPGLDTSETTVDTCLDLVRRLGKLAVRVEECASFLVNRLLGRYMNESLWCLQEGNVLADEIDTAACDLVMPVGPLTLRDMNGADIGLAVARFNYQEYGERFLPPPILEAMVEHNFLGQKTGKGFYVWDDETKKKQGINMEINDLVSSLALSTLPAQAKAEFFPERLFLPMINEAFLALQEKICHPSELDPALKAGLGMRKGPFELAEDIGLQNILKMTDRLFAAGKQERFRPAPLLKRYVWAGRKTVVNDMPLRAIASP